MDADGVRDAEDAGATVIREITSLREFKPVKPTAVSTIIFTAPTAISRGQSVTVNLANWGYSNLYDCTTWGYYRRDDNGVYNKWGTATSTKTTDYSSNSAYYKGSIKENTASITVLGYGSATGGSGSGTGSGGSGSGTGGSSGTGTDSGSGTGGNGGSSIGGGDYLPDPEET